MAFLLLGQDLGAAVKGWHHHAARRTQAGRHVGIVQVNHGCDLSLLLGKLNPQLLGHGSASPGEQDAAFLEKFLEPQSQGRPDGLGRRLRQDDERQVLGEGRELILGIKKPARGGNGAKRRGNACRLLLGSKDTHLERLQEEALFAPHARKRGRLRCACRILRQEDAHSDRRLVLAGKSGRRTPPDLLPPLIEKLALGSSRIRGEGCFRGGPAKVGPRHSERQGAHVGEGESLVEEAVHDLLQDLDIAEEVEEEADRRVPHHRCPPGRRENGIGFLALEGNESKVLGQNELSEPVAQDHIRVELVGANSVGSLAALDRCRENLADDLVVGQGRCVVGRLPEEGVDPVAVALFQTPEKPRSRLRIAPVRWRTLFLRVPKLVVCRAFAGALVRDAVEDDGAS